PSTKRRRRVGCAMACCSVWPRSERASPGVPRSCAGSRSAVSAHRAPRARVVLRPMRREDLPPALEIERQSFPQPWSRAFFEKELATPFARRTSAVDDGPPPRVVGYSCRWRVTDEVHLLNVAVHPERRGTGLGRELLEAVIAEGRESEARVVFLEV